MSLAIIKLLISNILYYKWKVNIVKSIYYTIRFKGCCIIGKALIDNDLMGRISIAPNCVLTIGILGTTTVPTQLLLTGTLKVTGCVDIYKGTKIVVSKDASSL